MEVSGHFHAPATLPSGKKPQLSVGERAGWASDSVWMLWSKEKSIVPDRNQTPAAQLPCRYCD
jgi:hypothetical protein